MKRRRSDKERLDFVQRYVERIDFAAASVGSRLAWLVGIPQGKARSSIHAYDWTLRAAIDRAMLHYEREKGARRG